MSTAVKLPLDAANPAVVRDLKAVKDVLTKKFGASQVILFGSHAYGHPLADSDLDICVILDLAGRRKIEWMRDIRRELASVVSSPLDILVYEQNEFDTRASLGSTLEHKILTQGIKLYEQSGRRTGMV